MRTAIINIDLCPIDLNQAHQVTKRSVDVIVIINIIIQNYTGSRITVIMLHFSNNSKKSVLIRARKLTR